MPESSTILGTSPLRKEGRAKVLGNAQYIDHARYFASQRLRAVTPPKSRR
jgi:CO/xanthine dehydrogenase Mo-binding subunit